MKRAAAALAALFAAGEAGAASQNVTVVNQAGAALTALAARPAGGGTWSPISSGLSPGARVAVSLSSDGCAYDVRATLAGGGQAVWSGVNFCETRSVTLNRRADGTLWIDYD